MTHIIEGPRRFNASGKDIEPVYVDGGRRLALARSEGQGIVIEGVSKSFGPVRVLDSLDLSIPAGQFVAIVGKSGCGKSTLLRLIAGLDEVDTGSIAFVDGKGNRVAPSSRIVFQEPRLLPWDRVADNVEVGLAPGDGRAPRRRRALRALDAVQLLEKADEWPSRLSGGQRQRVALARALVSQPALLALDEPLGALDALTRITMQGLVERVWQEQGFTALFVTHDVGEAVALADRVIVLDNGRIALDVPVNAPRPRERGTTEAAAIERRLLDAIFKR